MPPIDVYRVNFAQGNLTPSLDLPGWGDVRHGSSDGTGVTPQPPPEPDPNGIYLRLVRESVDITNQNETANSLYVVLPSPAVLPPDRSLPLYSRLRMSVEFDFPLGASLDVPDAPPAGPWAVVTVVKFGNQQDLPNDKFVAVTCQFNPKKNGVRLNTPGGLQMDEATVLDSPLDYGKYRPGCFGLWGPRTPTRFVLKHSFCGVKALPADLGYAVGSGALAIGSRSDERTYSNVNLSTGATLQGHIGALGVGLRTVPEAAGRFSVRFLGFSIAVWDWKPAPIVQPPIL